MPAQPDAQRDATHQLHRDPEKAVLALGSGGGAAIDAGENQTIRHRNELGYWVPDELASELRDVLEASTRAKRRAWLARKKTIIATSLESARSGSRIVQFS